MENNNICKIQTMEYLLNSCVEFDINTTIYMQIEEYVFV